MSKGTARRAIRIPDPLWHEFLAQTRAAGLNASETIRQLIRGWIDTNKQGDAE